MLRYFFISFFLATIAVIAICGFQGHHFQKPPLQIFPDMKVQPKFIAQHDTDFFADGREGRAPVPGTVPQGYIQPGDYSTNTASNSKVAVTTDAVTNLNGFANSLDYLNTGRIDGNYGDGIPDELRKDIPGLIERGKQRFTINCAVCHGATATGNGIVTQYGLVGVANLQQQTYRDMPDGQIFNRITYGKGKMGAYGPNIAVEDRWAIIAYLRALQRSQNGVLADVPPDQQNNLDQQTPAKQ